MKRRMPLGDFLSGYLGKLGVRHLFGIPGDLALKLFFVLGRKHGLKILTLSHAARSFAVIDIKVDVDDLSPMSVKYIKAAAKRSQTPPQQNGGRAGVRAG